MPTPARVIVVPPGETAPTLRVDEVKLPDPGPHQVIVKQFASGICHSQLHQMHRPRQSPVVLGHESTGVVLAKGKEVNHVKEGDRVMVTWVPRDGENTTRRAEPVTLNLEDGSTAVSQNVFTVGRTRRSRTSSTLSPCRQTSRPT
ncbi:MAG: alcohol dehydrogenase catalytic domain-containing protein [Dehalococcoidia bacterium]|nr:alcohol dehydrogenase catalytic domain-containing protein [Dehalococcoidia bacterium]